MGKKGLVTSIFSRFVETSPSSSPGGGGGVRASPPCWNNPQSTSFRAGDDGEGLDAATGRLQLRAAAAGGEMYRTVNSVYFDPAAADEVSSLDGGEEEVLDLDDESCCFASEEWSEEVIRSLGRSTSTHRFFFDPGPPSVNPILPAAVSAAAAHPDDDGEKQRPSTSEPSPSSLAEGSVAVAVDSADPFGDFRASMEEMVAAHGLRDWEALEELLSWYLRVNGKHNHPVIAAAFVDLLIDLASSTAATTATTTSITASSSGGKSTESSTTTSATSTTTTTAATEQCGRGADEASSRSSSSSSCATPDDSRSQDDVAEEEKTSDPGSSDGDHTRHKSEL